MEPEIPALGLLCTLTAVVATGKGTGDAHTHVTERMENW